MNAGLARRRCRRSFGKSRRGHGGERQCSRVRRLRIELLEDRRLLSDVVPNDPLFSDQWALDNTGQTGGTWDADIDASAAWPMKHGDIWNTGRADYAVPPERMNDSFFDIFLWQTPTPHSPNEGNLSSTSMVFFDGAGPAGADIVVGGYHWPKGVQGMDRHTGEVFWNGNPRGGESIGANTPAFSNDGSTVYVTNDATGSAELPNGHPLMAFESAIGPSLFWHNGADPDAGRLGEFSPKVAPDGRVFSHRWNDRPHAATDYGSSLLTTWSAASGVSSCYSNPTLYESAGELRVIGTGRSGRVKAFDGSSGAELWDVVVGQFTDADSTIDPANGNIYLPVGENDVYVVGLSNSGRPLWDSVVMRVYDWIDGQNNPQVARSTGALSHDAATYYFQTSSQQGDGRLYAVNTADGSVKWSFETHSQGQEMVSSSPIVTQNGVIVVGNNEGDTYYAIHDEGSRGVLLDTFTVDSAGNALATATLSPDGRLYLPLRTVQSVGNGSGEVPSYQVENLFTAIDLTADATVLLHPPGGQSAVALNHALSFSWLALRDPTGQFGHYAIYRATAPFDSVDGMVPIATVDNIHATEYVDTTAANGTSYYCAVTTVCRSGGEITDVEAIGPRTPRDETDLQMVSISRSPQYPRYSAQYRWHEITEPSGFGPYGFSASTGLGGGQTFDTQRFPNFGDPVTYIATIRNRGTNTYSGVLSGTWRVDDATVATPSQAVTLAPGETATVTYGRSWDNQPHALSFSVDLADARSGNNDLTSNTLAVPFLTYIDRSFVEMFREIWSPAHAGSRTDDVIDWLNDHMDRFNELFEDADCDKRVHYDVLEILDDGAPDPAIDQTPYAIFPFRYRHGESGDPRLSGYYHADDDIDYGLLHEMAHQLGLIDIYQLDVPAARNEVSGMGYTGPDGLMRCVSPFLSDHSALAMQHWLNDAHGYFGQYMYDLPQTIQLRILGFDGQPLEGATVKVYQSCERPGRGELITNQIKAQGMTDSDGLLTLPNVPIDPALVPVVGTGDELHDNPFGYVDVVGRNGVLHFRVEYGGGIDYAWLDITEANVAYWQGQTATAVFDRQVALGGEVQRRPPRDMTEINAEDWSTWVQGGTGSVEDDTFRKIVGESSLKFTTDGGFDNYVRYPRTLTAQWDLTGANHLNVSFYAENPNLGFQEGSPWIRLRDAEGDYFEYQYYRHGGRYDLLNQARGVWRCYQIPLNAPSDTQDGWRRTTHGTPDLTNIQCVEIHADTWGYGFTLWMDGIGFDLPEVVVFYNNSRFDGFDPAANATDDNAIAVDKAALLPGDPAAAFANYTTYSRGINGVIIDIAGLADQQNLNVADDFEFKFGNDNHPDGWSTAATPAIDIRPGKGQHASDRVTLIWENNAIPTRNWLEVRVKATENTGLAQDEVFYFGNAVGDADGDRVAACADMYAIYQQLGQPATVENLLDINRDGVITQADMDAVFPEIARLPVLNMITVPSVVATDDRVTTDEDTGIVIDLLANDRDVDGNPLSVAAADTTSALGARVRVFLNETVIYNPRGSVELQALAAGEIMEDTFGYMISDIRGGTDTRTVTVTVSGLDEPEGGGGAESFGMAAEADESVPLAMNLATGEDAAGNDEASVLDGIFAAGGLPVGAGGRGPSPAPVPWLPEQAALWFMDDWGRLRGPKGKPQQAGQLPRWRPADDGPLPPAVNFKGRANAPRMNRAAARDAVIAEATDRDSQSPETPLGESAWMWLYEFEFEQIRARKPSSNNGNLVGEAVDGLLAAGWM